MLTAFDAPRVLYGRKFRVRAQGGGRWPLEDRDGTRSRTAW
ncbi:hypothetical protein [Paraburkholderia sp. J94]|nr:hypothetical protein [Paraburkholderia sp. J94]